MYHMAEVGQGEGGNFISRLFGGLGKKKTPEAPVIAPEAPSPIAQSTPLPSGFEDRQQRLAERNRDQAQKTVQRVVRATEYDTQLREEKFKPRPQGERFRKMTKPKNVGEPITKPDTTPKVVPTPKPVLKPNTIQPPLENIPIQPVTPDMPKKKEYRQLDPVAARKSLENAGWERKSPTPPPTQPEPLTSVSPFEPESFPGADKWKPGKGAISMDEAMKIREEVKKMPDSYFDEEVKPVTETTKEEDIPTIQTPTPQEKVKEPA